MDSLNRDRCTIVIRHARLSGGCAVLTGTFAVDSYCIMPLFTVSVTRVMFVVGSDCMQYDFAEAYVMMTFYDCPALHDWKTKHLFPDFTHVERLELLIQQTLMVVQTKTDTS